ncbi:N-acetyltransferase [Henriciella barbarensis]|uniref:N-acetyltransferase n=1 Tax=Henriciella barbarensis TaxID=86342 RepID=A0A399R0J4_9PROT|nr:GNAT family N-acetyltransferase [Henriciella barbarensis]RIJ23815.1 N-acetyltransferase [Henriciella barbarensis]
MADLEIKHAESGSGGVFYTIIDGHRAEMTYSTAGTTVIIIDHTGVPEALGGQGVGQKLVEAGIAHARERGIKIMPLCPFAKAQFDKHPDWKDVLR